jgi:high affinity choline transporter 7
VAFCVSLALRLGGGEPLFGIPPIIPYPEILTSNPSVWYEAGTGALLFPYKTLAALTGLILLPLVSRMTARWDNPVPLYLPSGKKDAAA